MRITQSSVMGTPHNGHQLTKPSRKKFSFHLATSSPDLFLLSETQLSSQSSPAPFQISHYNLYSHFRSKGGICAYCNINTPIARLMDLESHHFDVLWLKIYLPTTTIFLCFCYCSPNATNFPSFWSISLLAMSIC